MENKCKQCGMCCRAIFVHMSPESFDNLLITTKTYNSTFVHDHWKRITYEEACNINPLFATEKYKVELNDEAYTFFTCDCFDSEINKCKVYDDRPPVCKDYPFYGETLSFKGEYNLEKWYSSTCGWKEYYENLPDKPKNKEEK